MDSCHRIKTEDYGDYSVLMSVYHKETAENLRKAIDSMLSQSVAPKDFVLVCDGALTEELDAVIEEYFCAYPEIFQILRLPQNRGLGFALSEGMKLCRFEMVARMDSDDVAVRTRMEMQLSVLRADTSLAAVGGQIAEFRGDINNVIGYRIVPLASEAVRKRLPKRCPMNHVTVTLRKALVQAAGGYQHFPSFEDYHLWCRMLAKGCRMQNIQEVCCYVRMEDSAYLRRGGWDYFCRTLAMERYMKKLGFVSDLRFFINVLTRFGGTVLLPNRAREYFYLRLLRKTKVG